MGRPPLGPKAKSEKLTLRVTPAERKRLEAEAKRLGVTLADVLMRPWREDKEA